MARAAGLGPAYPVVVARWWMMIMMTVSFDQMEDHLELMLKSGLWRGLLHESSPRQSFLSCWTHYLTMSPSHNSSLCLGLCLCECEGIVWWSSNAALAVVDMKQCFCVIVFMSCIWLIYNIVFFLSIFYIHRHTRTSKWSVKIAIFKVYSKVQTVSLARHQHTDTGMILCQSRSCKWARGIIHWSRLRREAQHSSTYGERFAVLRSISLYHNRRKTTLQTVCRHLGSERKPCIRCVRLRDFC